MTTYEFIIRKMSEQTTYMTGLQEGERWCRELLCYHENTLQNPVYSTFIPKKGNNGSKEYRKLYKWLSDENKNLLK
ncbi:hypothetical protein VPH166E361_0120 [Vibrio phage 166E36-1]